jgi:hypothetical protein
MSPPTSTANLVAPRLPRLIEVVGTVIGFGDQFALEDAVGDQFALEDAIGSPVCFGFNPATACV